MRPSQRIANLGVTLLRRVLAEAPPDALHLGLGVSNIDVPTPIRDALRDAPAARRADYGPNAGNPALRQAIAAANGVPGDQVIVTAGVQQGIALALLGTVDPGDDVLVPAPAFPVYASLTEVAGGRAVPYELTREDRFRPTWQAIRDAITPQTKLAVVCSPGNPTGATATAEEWAAIGEGLASANVGALSDEIYLPLQHTGPQHGSLRDHHPDTLVLGGLAKSHGLAGWRLGWLVAPEPLVGPLTALHQHLTTSASTLVQEAALGAFSAEGTAGVRMLNATLRTRRERAKVELERAGFEVLAGDGAFYLWFQRPGWGDDLALCRSLMHRAKVVTIPGRAFGPAGNGCLRLSYSVDDATLDEALRRIGEWGANHANETSCD